MRTRLTTAAILATALLFAGCSSGSTETASEPRSDAATPAASTSGEKPAARPISLPADTRLGTTTLVAHDQDRLVDYYSKALGMSTLATHQETVTLGYDGQPVLDITAAPDAPARALTDAGLYHTAVLYPDETTLADVLLTVATHAPESFSGSADHRVSQAFYFTDPEGNGVELYVDRPEDEWVWEDGEVVMGSEPLDVNAFITDHATNPDRLTSANPDALAGSVGHMHLAVGDLAAAEEGGGQGRHPPAEGQGARDPRRRPGACRGPVEQHRHVHALTFGPPYRSHYPALQAPENEQSPGSLIRGSASRARGGT